MIKHNTNFSICKSFIKVIVEINNLSITTQFDYILFIIPKSKYEISDIKEVTHMIGLHNSFFNNVKSLISSLILIFISRKEGVAIEY